MVEKYDGVQAMRRGGLYVDAADYDHKCEECEELSFLTTRDDHEAEMAKRRRDIKIRGVGRDSGHVRFLSVAFDREPTDDELRAFHDFCRDFTSETTGEPK